MNEGFNKFYILTDLFEMLREDSREHDGGCK